MRFLAIVALIFWSMPLPADALRPVKTIRLQYQIYHYPPNAKPESICTGTIDVGVYDTRGVSDYSIDPATAKCDLKMNLDGQSQPTWVTAALTPTVVLQKGGFPVNQGTETAKLDLFFLAGHYDAAKEFQHTELNDIHLESETMSFSGTSIQLFNDKKLTSAGDMLMAYVRLID